MCLNACMHVCMYACKLTSARIYVSMYAYLFHLFTYLRTYLSMFPCFYVCTYICTSKPSFLVSKHTPRRVSRAPYRSVEEGGTEGLGGRQHAPMKSSCRARCVPRRYFPGNRDACGTKCAVHMVVHHTIDYRMCPYTPAIIAW